MQKFKKLLALIMATVFSTAFLSAGIVAEAYTYHTLPEMPEIFDYTWTVGKEIEPIYFDDLFKEYLNDKTITRLEYGLGDLSYHTEYLPSGIKFDSEKGVISGTPTNAEDGFFIPNVNGDEFSLYEVKWLFYTIIDPNAPITTTTDTDIPTTTTETDTTTDETTTEQTPIAITAGSNIKNNTGVPKGGVTLAIIPTMIASIAVIITNNRRKR